VRVDEHGEARGAEQFHASEVDDGRPSVVLVEGIGERPAKTWPDRMSLLSTWL